ncbi:MAG: hypothetical protein ACRC92_26165 [Peptostreptococcaceae bacterium]
MKFKTMDADEAVGFLEDLESIYDVDLDDYKESIEDATYESTYYGDEKNWALLNNDTDSVVIDSDILAELIK